MDGCKTNENKMNGYEMNENEWKGYEKINFRNGKELQALCGSRALPISEIMLLRECSLSEKSRGSVLARMGHVWEITKDSAHSPIDSPKKSMGGLIGGEAQALFLHRAKGKTVCGDTFCQEGMGDE